MLFSRLTDITRDTMGDVTYMCYLSKLMNNALNIIACHLEKTLTQCRRNSF